ncbi:MAG: spermidine/putrescine ABC transporter permease PotC [Pseudomonadales bacterium]|uniref:Spermidine/putrescine transport system permease protein PotC n=1 Tax=Oleiphilus messinensis TaxID=141451 RepID=A0A1Y0ICC9_9GAMM|nr:spermidine/putrescine ABC transporter permease PotC [Oleiphilus messinensis]ARU58188.1 spermidine/putrescine ABC transporter membrane protein [Oleiphilus messinensis]MCG8610347.1 spermidine/putrescine ABC transporter permease PotC [Pseudomonadales bacterium]
MKIFKISLVVLIFVYLYLPMAVLVTNSFNKSKYGHEWKGFSTKWYEKLWDNDALMQAFSNSLTIAVLAATLATVLGTLIAQGLYRYRFPLKKLSSGMLFVLMLSPDIVLAITFLVIFIAIGIQLGFWSLLISHITFCLPFVVITVYAQLKDFDRNILEAAQDLGATEWQTFYKIMLPTLFPAILSGWLLSFTLSLDDVIISSFVTGPGFEILPVRVFSMVKVGVSPEVNALATILLAISLILVALITLILKRKRLA